MGRAAVTCDTEARQVGVREIADRSRANNSNYVHDQRLVQCSDH